MGIKVRYQTVSVQNGDGKMVLWSERLFNGDGEEHGEVECKSELDVAAAVASSISQYAGQLQVLRPAFDLWVICFESLQCIVVAVAERVQEVDLG